MSEYIYGGVAIEHGAAKGEARLERREEIVRCRDCANLNIVGKCPCGFWALENLNGFCAWGERK